MSGVLVVYVEQRHVFLLVLQFSPVSIIPQMLYTTISTFLHKHSILLCVFASSTQSYIIISNLKLANGQNLWCKHFSSLPAFPIVSLLWSTLVCLITLSRNVRAINNANLFSATFFFYFVFYYLTSLSISMFCSVGDEYVIEYVVFVQRYL